MQEAVVELQSVCDEPGSQLLHSLVTPGQRFPEMEEALAQLTSATDWDAACETGQIVPSKVRTRICWTYIAQHVASCDPFYTARSYRLALLLVLTAQLHSSLLSFSACPPV